MSTSPGPVRRSTAGGSPSRVGMSMRLPLPEVPAASPARGALALREPASGDATVHLPYLVRVMGPATAIEDVPIGDVDERPDGGLHIAGRGARFEAAATWSPPRG